MDALIPKFSLLLLIFVRISCFFVVMPFFSYKSVPTVFKMGLAAVLAWLISYNIPSVSLQLDGMYVILLLKEAFIGLFIGFLSYLLLSMIQVAGSFLDFQMGYSIANVIDPQTGTQTPLVSQYIYTFALLLFLSLNAHYLLLDGIYYSYQFIPVDQFIPINQTGIITFVFQAFSRAFIIAFQMSIPVVGTIFLVDLALGIVARTVPQVNIFVIGFPIKILISFMIIIIVFGSMFLVCQQLFSLMLTTMRDVMAALGGKQ